MAGKRKTGKGKQKEYREESIHRRAYILYRSGASLSDVADYYSMPLSIVEDWAKAFDWDERIMRPIDKVMQRSSKLEKMIGHYSNLTMFVMAEMIKYMREGGDREIIETNPKTGVTTRTKIKFPRLPFYVNLSLKDMASGEQSLVEIQKWLLEPRQQEILERTKRNIEKDEVSEDRIRKLDEKIRQAERKLRAAKARKSSRRKRNK